MEEHQRKGAEAGHEYFVRVAPAERVVYQDHNGSSPPATPEASFNPGWKITREIHGEEEQKGGEGRKEGPIACSYPHQNW